MIATASAGWFPDPGGRHQWRYWDGTRWTDTVADQGVTSVEPVDQPGVHQMTESPPRGGDPTGPPGPGQVSPSTYPARVAVMVGRVAVGVCLALAWPAAQLAVFWLRFGDMPPGGPGESLVFLPMSVVGAVAAVCLWSMADSRRQRHYVAAGYLLAIPIAFSGALVGGLVLPWFLAPLVFGGLPLVAGSYAGFVMGRTQSAAPAWRTR